MRKRKKLYDKAKQLDTHNAWTEYRRIRNETTTAIRNAKENDIDKLAKTLTTDTASPSDWWRTLKRFIKPNTNSSCIPPLKTNDDIFDDNKDKANLLNTYFQTQTQINDLNANTPHADFNQDRPQLNSIIISPLEVKSVLQTLKLGKASGPDLVNNRILKELCNELCTPLCNFFNRSLQISKMPSQWKMA